MKPYAVYLLDADETLFDFRKAEKNALEKVFSAHGFPWDETVLAQYREINEALWRALERGETTKGRLQSQRFSQLFALLGIDADPVRIGGEEYPDALAEGNFLLEGALETCRELASRARLYLATNGITRVQKKRLQNSPLAPYISDIFVSEEAGAAKPNRAYFSYVLSQIGEPPKGDVLMVGDSLTSDMAGGWNAGIDTCWYNPENAPLPEVGSVTWQNRRLSQLLE